MISNLRTKGVAVVAAAAAAASFLAGCTTKDRSLPSEPGATHTAPTYSASPQSASAGGTPTQAAGGGVLSARERFFGLPKDPNSGREYLSGVWLGGDFHADALREFGNWRHAPVETITTYADTTSWDAMRQDWTIGTWDGAEGTLVYGLGLIPHQGGGTLADVANGKQDAVFHQVGKNLVKHNRGRSIVRIGLEANGHWFPWHASDQNAEDYKRAYRHVAQILKQEAPDLILDFDLACGVALQGSSDPMAPLVKAYPGDDVVDIVGCDIYDDKTLKFDSDQVIGASDNGPGLQDVYDFAVSHGKPMSIPEWGLNRNTGTGDNAAFIEAMHRFIAAHAQGIVLENYFNEPNTDLKSSLWGNVQNPNSAQTYARLW